MSYRFSVDAKSRKVGRFLGRVRREIQRAFEEEKKARGLTQAEIARLLDTDRSVINRQLTGTENLTLRRVGELGWVFGREIEFSMTKRVVPAGANILYEIATSSAPEIPETLPAAGVSTTTSFRPTRDSSVTISRSV